MRGRSGLAFLVAIVIAFGCALSARAQVGITAAQLSGVIQDKSGGAVAKATITLTDVATNRTYTATSDVSGYYVLPNLLPGTYELKVAYPGFSTYLQKGIVLSVGQTATVNVTLEIKAVGQQVVVTGAVQAIEPTRTEISNVINDKSISSLPISGRLFTDFVLLTPGVATGRTSLGSTITEFEVTRISFGGMRDLDNLVTVDGADNINTADGSQRATPPQSSVSEFRVVNNDYGAEYGRALGGIVNVVTKSGTNNLHGSAYEYLQNNATDARSLIQAAPQPNVLRQNQFGDNAAMGLAVAGIAIPNYVVAPILTLIFGIYLGLLPVGGWNDGALRNMILPVTTLALPLIAYITRLTRGSMIEVLRSDYIRTARAKGLPMRIIIWRHALPAAILPVVTFLGPAAAGVLTGSLVVEQIFGLPGIGRYFVQGALNRDYTLVMGVVILYASLIIILNLVVDLAYAALDPKVRFK